MKAKKRPGRVQRDWSSFSVNRIFGRDITHARRVTKRWCRQSRRNYLSPRPTPFSPAPQFLESGVSKVGTKSAQEDKNECSVETVQLRRRWWRLELAISEHIRIASGLSTQPRSAFFSLQPQSNREQKFTRYAPTPGTLEAEVRRASGLERGSMTIFSANANRCPRYYTSGIRQGSNRQEIQGAETQYLYSVRNWISSCDRAKGPLRTIDIRVFC